MCDGLRPARTRSHSNPRCAIALRSARGGLVILILICILSALLGRLSFLFRPFDPDGAMYVYMGKLVSQGGRVGYELVDNKFPTVGLLTSGCWRIFGDDWPGYVLLQMALVLAAVLLLARSARQNIGRHAGIAAGLFAPFYSISRSSADFNWRRCRRSFCIVASASAALYSLCRDDVRDSMLVGLAAGTAAMLKPSGLGVLAAFAAATLFQRRRELRRLTIHAVAAAAGLAIPLAATLAYLISADLLREMPAICARSLATPRSHRGSCGTSTSRSLSLSSWGFRCSCAVSSSAGRSTAR